MDSAYPIQLSVLYTRWFSMSLEFQIKVNLCGPMQTWIVLQSGKRNQTGHPSPKWQKVNIYSFKYYCIIHRPPGLCALFLKKFSTWLTITLSNTPPVIIFGDVSIHQITIQKYPGPSFLELFCPRNPVLDLNLSIYSHGQIMALPYCISPLISTLIILPIHAPI